MKKLIVALIALFALPAFADGAGDWPSSSSGGHTIQDEASNLPARTTLNFTGAGITCADGSGKTNCDAPGPSSATVLDQTAGETDLRYDATEECYYLDIDGDAVHDASEAEQCMDGTVDGTFASDDRKLYCNPIAYERNGTTTTNGIQECIDQVGTYGGGTVLLGPRIYKISGASAITVDEGSGNEVHIVGAGAGSTVIRCNTADSCTATVVVALLDNFASMSNLTVSSDVATNTVVQIGDASNYTSHNMLRDVYITGPTQTAGSRTGTGLLIQGLEAVIDNVTIEKWQKCVDLKATAAGRVNAIYITDSDMSSCDYGVYTNVGNFAANTGDSQQFTVNNTTIQSMYNYGLQLTGGSSDSTNFNSVILDDVYIEGADTAVNVTGSAASYDPNVHWFGGTCASMVDAADAGSTSDCVVTDSSTDDVVWIQGVYTNSVQCLTIAGTTTAYIQGNYNSSSTCNAAGASISGSAKLRDLDVDAGWIDEAMTLTADWKAVTASANDNDTSLATTAYVQTELSAYASDTVTFTNKSATGGGVWDLGGATSFEVPNGADPTTDAFGEIAGDNDAYAAGRGVAEFYDGTSSTNLVGVLASDAPANGECPKFNTGGTITWESCAGSGGAFSDASDPVVLNTTTKDVVVGASQINSSKLTVDGDADQTQFTIQSHSTQTSSPFIMENSSGTELLNFNNSGDLKIQSLQDIDGPGTNWSVDTSGNAIFASVTTAATATPTVTFNDSNSASESTDATISAEATDAVANQEDVDLDFKVQVNSTITSRFYIDADGQVQVKNGALEVDASDPADSGAIRLDNAEGIAWEASPAGTDVLMAADSSEIIQITGGTLDGGDLTSNTVTATQLSATVTLADGDLFDFSSVNPNTSTEGIKLPTSGTSCASATAEGQVCWRSDTDVLSVGTGAGITTFSSGGDNISVDGGAVVDPNFASTGDIDMVNTANTITANLNSSVILVGDVADGDWGDFTVATNVATIDANAVTSAKIATIVESMYWGAGAVSTDGTQCATPAEVTINSGPKTYAVVCADNDASTIWGSVVMPDGWDGGTVTFELSYVQTAADTNAMNSDISAECRGSGETINSTLGSEVAIDDTNVSGSNVFDTTTSAAVTADGTCAAGDILAWRWQLDATGTTTAVATLDILGVKMEYTSNVGD